MRLEVSSNNKQNAIRAGIHELMKSCLNNELIAYVYKARANRNLPILDDQSSVSITHLYLDGFKDGMAKAIELILDGKLDIRMMKKD